LQIALHGGSADGNGSTADNMEVCSYHCPVAACVHAHEASNPAKLLYRTGVAVVAATVNSFHTLHYVHWRSASQH
jgi:hypothetical protein